MKLFTCFLITAWKTCSYIWHSILLKGLSFSKTFPHYSCYLILCNIVLLQIVNVCFPYSSKNVVKVDLNEAMRHSKMCIFRLSELATNAPGRSENDSSTQVDISAGTCSYHSSRWCGQSMHRGWNHVQLSSSRFMLGKNLFPVMLSLSQVKRSIPIKISKESVPCWAFRTLGERKKIIWKTCNWYINVKIFYLVGSANVDTRINNSFSWKVKNGKFSIISPFVEHTEFVTGKVRCSCSLIFHQLSGKGHDINILETSYAGATKKIPSENNLEKDFCHTIFF